MRRQGNCYAHHTLSTAPTVCHRRFECCTGPSSSCRHCFITSGDCHVREVPQSIYPCHAAAALSRNETCSSPFLPSLTWPRMLLEMFCFLLLGLSTLLGASASTSAGGWLRASFETAANRSYHHVGLLSSHLPRHLIPVCPVCSVGCSQRVPGQLRARSRRKIVRRPRFKCQTDIVDGGRQQTSAARCIVFELAYREV